MTLMNVPRLIGFVRVVAHLLRPSSAFVFTITHPWFWPTYRSVAGTAREGAGRAPGPSGSKETAACPRQTGSVTSRRRIGTIEKPRFQGFSVAGL